MDATRHGVLWQPAGTNAGDVVRVLNEGGRGHPWLTE